MTNNPIIKYYWGIGLENETYFQLEEWLEVSGQFIQEKWAEKDTASIISLATAMVPSMLVCAPLLTLKKIQSQ